MLAGRHCILDLSHEAVKFWAAAFAISCAAWSMSRDIDMGQTFVVIAYSKPSRWVSSRVLPQTKHKKKAGNAGLFGGSVKTDY
jgi:hypothetical protein